MSETTVNKDVFHDLLGSCRFLSRLPKSIQKLSQVCVLTFDMVLLPKEMVLNMWFAMARTQFKYFVCQTNDGVVPVCQ